LDGSNFTFASRGPACRPNSSAHREKDGCTRPLRRTKASTPVHSLGLGTQPRPVQTRFAIRATSSTNSCSDVRSFCAVFESSYRISPRQFSPLNRGHGNPGLPHNSPPIPTHHSQQEPCCPRIPKARSLSFRSAAVSYDCGTVQTPSASNPPSPASQLSSPTLQKPVLMSGKMLASMAASGSNRTMESRTGRHNQSELPLTPPRQENRRTSKQSMKS
jgi:hypothetical protein